MQAGNDSHGQPFERVVFPAVYDNQFGGGHTVRPREVVSAFGSNDRRPGSARDVGRIQGMVVVCVRKEDKVGALNMRVDGPCIGLSDGGVVEQRASVGGIKSVVWRDPAQP